MQNILELSRNYINDRKVVEFIENNSHILSIGTISDLKFDNFGLEIETSSKDISSMLIRNGFKLSSGEIIKVKVTYTNDKDLPFSRMHSMDGPDFRENPEQRRSMNPNIFEHFSRQKADVDPWLNEQASNLNNINKSFGISDNLFNNHYNKFDY